MPAGDQFSGKDATPEMPEMVWGSSIICKGRITLSFFCSSFLHYVKEGQTISGISGPASKRLWRWFLTHLRVSPASPEV